MEHQDDLDRHLRQLLAGTLECATTLERARLDTAAAALRAPADRFAARLDALGVARPAAAAPATPAAAVEPRAAMERLDAVAAAFRDQLGPLGERDRPTQDVAIVLTATLDRERFSLRGAL